MRERSPPHVRDLLTGLAPAGGASCPRCGEGTVALANGRGRIEICGGCGTMDLREHDGDLLRLRAELATPGLPGLARRRGSP